MGMMPELFFETFVEGNLLDCKENPGCVRRAFNAAVSASHLADHYFEFSLRSHPALVNDFSNIGKFVEHIAKQTDGAFRDVRSIANAYKHLYTDATSKYSAYSNLNSCGAIESIELIDDEDLVELTVSSYFLPELDHVRSSVLFTRKDETTAEFLPILEVVVAYWRWLLYRSS